MLGYGTEWRYLYPCCAGSDCNSRKENPQKLTQLSSRSHPSSLSQSGSTWVTFTNQRMSGENEGKTSTIFISLTDSEFCVHFQIRNRTYGESRKENPQKLTQLSSRSHPRHLVGKRTAQKRHHHRQHKRQPGEQQFPKQVVTG